MEIKPGMRWHRTGLIFLALVLLAVWVWAFPTGAPPQHTGGFGEPTCIQCHSDFSLNPAGGSLAISGVPDNYNPGTIYPITVTIQHSTARRWGFELAARFVTTQQQAGQILITDPLNTQISVASQVQYITHTLDGTRAGLIGPITFTFNWQAPSSAAGTIRFNAAGNAANNNGNTSGDRIYTVSKDSTPIQASTSTTVVSTTTSIRPVSSTNTSSTVPVISTTSSTLSTTSTSTSTTSTFPPATLVLPYKAYFTQLANRTSRRTGFALTNQNPLPATVRLTAYDNNGRELRSAGGAFANPVILPVVSGSQLARVVFESDIFGVGLGNANGWFLVESDRTGITGFYLLFNDDLTVMDGTDVSEQLYAKLLLPEVQNAEIALVNPGTNPALVTLGLIGNQGSPVGKTATVTLPAKGRYAGPPSSLFTLADINAAGYMSVSSDQPLAASEIVSATDVFLFSLNPIDPGAGDKLLFSPQYVVGGGFYKTVLTLINLENTSTNVQLSLVGDDGNVVGRSATVDLPAKGRTVFSDASTLGINPSGPLVQGYIRLSSSSTKISGYVRFGDPRDAQFQTALPFVSQGRTSLLYSQVAQDDLFFTGAALINPNPDAADIFISVFDTEGVRIGAGNTRIPANGRISRLLPELIPGLPSMKKGYFKILSSRPLLSFGVFGTHSLSVLSAVPPQ